MWETGAMIEILPIYANMTIIETEYYAIEGVTLWVYNAPLEMQLGKIYLN